MPEKPPAFSAPQAWRDPLLSLGYRDACVDALFADTPQENISLFERALVICEEEKEASALFGKRVFSLVLLEADAADYKSGKRDLQMALRQWLSDRAPDFASTRILTRHLHKWHALASLGFFPVETLIHLFYELTPEFYGADILTSDIIPMSEVSNDDLMDLLKKAGVKSHIHLDPYLNEELGDYAISMYLERLARSPGAVVSRRGDRLCGFLVVGRRPIPLPGYPPLYELVIGAVDPALADRAAVFRDMVSVLSSRAPDDASLFEVRIPHTWFPEVLLLVRAHPVSMETSVVLHYLKDVAL
jgi:hypothetical protein